MTDKEFEYESDLAASDAARDIAIAEGTPFEELREAASALGRAGGRIGGRSRSLLKREAARMNLVKAREAKREKTK